MSDILPSQPMRKLFLVISPFFVVAVGLLFFLIVDLEPKITADFFFSSESRIYQQDQAIQKKFPFQQQVLLNVPAQDITGSAYLQKIRRLSERIQAVDGVDTVHSLTHGPDDLEAALENPLWQRMLVGEGQKSSFVIALISTDHYKSLIGAIEEIIAEEETRGFDIRISGLPYIVEQIRRNLETDMKNFTAGAVLLSALVLLFVFRSFLLVLGALLACVTAAMLTLVIQSLMGIPIGILTANLGTIVFVLAQSHIIFIVANWCNAATHEGGDKLSKAIAHTFPASFWAMMTTLLGFASLLFVEAKPLNELGWGGVVGTFAALVSAYTIFPAFLRFSKLKPHSFTYALARKFPLPKTVALGLTLVALLTAGALGGYGVRIINTDPSLLSYFKDDSPLYNGLYHIDRNGGSNPLTIVVSRTDGAPLDNGAAYEQMWALQQGLARHESVGSILSLPVIMAEGDEHWLGQFLPWNTLLDILSKPEYGAVARSFMNDGRTEALFMLRMKETGRTQDRLAVIEDIQSIPPQYGFKVTMTGGTYYLQAQLADMVAASMTTGIISLILLFGFIALFLSRSPLIAGAIMICASCIALIVLGTLGLLAVPVDIISSPSLNVCLGLIVDDMIHLTVTAKRLARESGKHIRDKDVWKSALDGQSWPALVSTITIMIGFSVFALSDFPPSQRFGLEIVYGAGLAVLLALGVFPFLVTCFQPKKTS